MAFTKATRKRVKLKLAIMGASGSGKTFSALRLATGLGGRIAVIDTENSSASLYADKFAFDTVDIHPPFDDSKFIEAIQDAVSSGYEVLIIDSASHCWKGILDWKSKLDSRGGNSYMNWNEAGRKFDSVIDAILQSPIHVICCLRSKQDYVLEMNEKGKQVPRKVGLAPVMRDGIDYEFSTAFDVEMDHTAKTSKDRSGLFHDSIFTITEDTGKLLLEWVNSGAPPAVADPPTVAGSAPQITRPVNAEWTDELKAEAGAIRSEIARYPNGEARFSKLWKSMKQDPPTSVLDALADLRRELEDVNHQSQETTP